MTVDDVRIRGSVDAESIAAVLAVLHRVQAAPAPAPVATGTARWRADRRAALARTAATSRR